MHDTIQNKQYKYIYCVVNKKIESIFGNIGINENKVYSIPYGDFSVIVNDSSAEEIKNKKDIDLAIEHQYVLDFVMKKFNTIIPFNAGTLIKEDKIKNWIEKDNEKLTKTFEKIKNKQEFGIQIFYQSEIKKVNDEIKNITSYILEQKKFRKELMSELMKCKEEFYNQISEFADEVKNMEISSSITEPTLLNLACLVDKNKIIELKNYLRKINKKEFTVNFNGPWPPYSFVD